jgi:hypothetical protein
MHFKLSKKIIPAILLTAICLSLLPLPVRTVQAAGEKCVSTSPFVDKTDPSNWRDPLSRGDCGLGYEFVPSTLSGTPGAQQAIEQYRANQAANLAASGGDFGCTFTVASIFSNCIAMMMYYIGPGLASYVAYIGASFFSVVIALSLNSIAYALDFLSQGWTTVRDFANMAFIFILIYIAMTVMLQAETAGTIKTLAIVVVIALLVNFSFFFTRVVIDTGNILALQFYNAIEARGPTGAPALIGQGNNTNAGAVKDLSASIMNAVQIDKLYGSDAFEKAKGACGTGSSVTCGLIISTLVYLAVAIMFWMLFFAFLQVGIKFLLRIVGLWFLLIASPLAFVAKTMHKTEKYFDEWLKKLIEFSAYPAIFLFMFLVLTKITTSLLTVQGQTGGLFNAAFNANTGAAGAANSSNYAIGIASAIAAIGIRMGFVIALMYVALRASDWVVKEGSGIASKISGGITGKTLGVAGFAGRNTVGWAGFRLGQTKFMQKVGARGIVGRNLLAGVNRIGTASFDARNSKTLNKSLGVLGGQMDTHGKVSPLDFGKSGNKKGYKEDFDARVKALQKEAEQFKAPTESEKKAAQEAGKKRATTEVEKKAENVAKKDEFGKEAIRIKNGVETTQAAHETASREEKEAEKRLSDADEKVKKLDLMNKRGTPEMSVALNARDRFMGEMKLKKEAAVNTLKTLEEFKKEADALKAQENELKDKMGKEVEALTKRYTREVDNRKVFADFINSRNGNVLKTAGLWVPKANTTAAEKIRKGKSKQDELMEKIKEIQKDEEGEKKGEEKGEEKKKDDH